MNFTLFDVYYSCVTVNDEFTSGSWPVYAFTAKDAAKKARKDLKALGSTRIRIKSVKESDASRWSGWTGAMIPAC